MMENIPAQMDVKDGTVDLDVNERLHEWEKLDDCAAPLSTFQRNTCLDLGDEVISRPFPSCLIDDSYDRIEGSDCEIRTTRQFLDWYMKISDKWLEQGNEKFVSQLQELIKKRDNCYSILERVESTVMQLDLLKSEYDLVSCKTSPLYTISQKVSVDQAELMEVLHNIKKRLCAFQIIESVTKRLEASAVAVTSDEFLNILNEIDSSIEYFQENASYKESSVYLMKSWQCLSKALADVKSYIISVLDTCKMISTNTYILPTSGMERGDEIISKGSKFVLQYGRFQTVAVRLKPLLMQLENRFEKSYEYESTLEECLNYYVNLRQQIIGPELNDSILQLVSSQSGNYCSLLRSICTNLMYISHDESNLYSQFFSKPSKVFGNFVESLCSTLYDTMRPLVIQVKHMETLAEFCSILRSGILQEHVKNKEDLQPFGRVVEQLLKDVQERLVFRAHIYFKADILQFKPSAGDLAYPEKLEMMKNIANEIQNQEAAALARYDSRLSLESIGSCGDSIRSGNRISQRSMTNRSTVEFHGMWYPTIRRTLVCLSRLYRCLEKPVFQGLAQEAIACCCENVNAATQIICETKTTLDGQLFQIKHLLILREQISPFQVDFTATEMSIDFNKLKSAAYGLLQKQTLFSFSSNNAILEFILHGSPLLKENYLDSRKIVDLQLKNTCEAFISQATTTVTAPINDFLLKVVDHKKSGKTNSIRKEPFAKPDHVQNIVRECMKRIKSQVPMLLHKMDLYLANQDTQFILYKPIKNNVVSTFANLKSAAENIYDVEDQLLIGCPTPEQVSVLLSSTILSNKGNIVEQTLPVTTVSQS